MLRSSPALFACRGHLLRPPGYVSMPWFWTRKTSNTASALAASTHLGRLYETARGTFRPGRIPSEGDVDRVKKLVAAVPIAELGLDESVASEEKRRSSWWSGLGFGRQRQQPHQLSRLPVIRYSEICENEDFCICVFYLPTGCSLPFHDHPEMTVFSRVLYGQLQLKAYDWVGERTHLELGEMQPASLAVEKAVTKDDEPIVLFPRLGNIHSFQADSACAVLDVIAPPYDHNIPERSCGYYKEIIEPDGTVSLKKIKDPKSARVESSPYRGVRVG